MLYKQLHIYRRPFAINGCQKPWSRPEKNQKNAPRIAIFVYAASDVLKLWESKPIPWMAAVQGIVWILGLLLQVFFVFLAEDLSICCRGEPFLFFEKPAKVECIFIPDHRSNVGNVILCSFQERLCVSYPDWKYIFHRRCANCIFKTLIKPASTYMPG